MKPAWYINAIKLSIATDRSWRWAKSKIMKSTVWENKPDHHWRPNGNGTFSTQWWLNLTTPDALSLLIILYEIAKVLSEYICTEILDWTSIGNHRSVVYKFYKFEINSLISFLCAVLSSSQLLFLHNITRLLSLVL